MRILRAGDLGVTTSWDEAHLGIAGVPPAHILPQLHPSPPPESTGSGALPLLRPGPCGSRRQGGRLQHRRETERQPKGQHAGGTPALPGGLHPMTSSHQGQKIAEAFWRRLWLKEVHLSSGLFVFIRVHSWFVFNNDQPFVLAGSAHQVGARLSGKREFPKGDRPAFREVARRIPPTSPSGRPTRERGRPARMLSLRLPLSFPAMSQPTALPAGTAWARPKESQGAAAGRFRWRRWPRLCQAWCGRDARAQTNHKWTRMNTNRPEDRWTSFSGKRHQSASAILCPWCDEVMG